MKKLYSLFFVFSCSPWCREVENDTTWADHLYELKQGIKVIPIGTAND
jgi:hypothetical protein